MFLCLGLAAQAQINDAKDDAYAEWNRLSYREKMVFAGAALVGAAFAYTMYLSHGKGDTSIFNLLPLGMTNLQAVQLVDQVYKNPANRNIPYVGIILMPGKFLTGGTLGSFKKDYYN